MFFFDKVKEFFLDLFSKNEIPKAYSIEEIQMEESTQLRRSQSRFEVDERHGFELEMISYGKKIPAAIDNISNLGVEITLPPQFESLQKGSVFEGILKRDKSEVFVEFTVSWVRAGKAGCFVNSAQEEFTKTFNKFLSEEFNKLQIAKINPKILNGTSSESLVWFRSLDGFEVVLFYSDNLIQKFFVYTKKHYVEYNKFNKLRCFEVVRNQESVTDEFNLKPLSELDPKITKQLEVHVKKHQFINEIQKKELLSIFIN